MEFVQDLTLEERHRRVDEILARNSEPPKICISCLEEIPDNHSIINSRHGYYHGLPRTCEDGRPEHWSQK